MNENRKLKTLCPNSIRYTQKLYRLYAQYQKLLSTELANKDPARTSEEPVAPAKRWEPLNNKRLSDLFEQHLAAPRSLSHETRPLKPNIKLSASRSAAGLEFPYIPSPE